MTMGPFLTDRLLTDAGILADDGRIPDMRWGPALTPDENGIGGFLGTGTYQGTRFVARRVRTRKGALLSSICSDYGEAMAHARESAGYGTGIGGFPHFGELARTMFAVGPECDRAAWQEIIERFQPADASVKARAR